MAIAYRCDPESELTVSVWDGPVSAKEWHAQLRRFREDPEAGATWKHLVDMRFGQGDSGFDAAAIQRGIDFMTHNVSQFAGMRLAVVSGTEHESVRFFGNLAEQAKVSVVAFQDLPSACAWLGVEPSRTVELIAAIRMDMVGRGTEEP
jgi:hypothetical protein